jgi:hypothetical protein
MRVDEIRSIARERGIKAGKMTKAELVQAIQRAEGNCDCFGDAGRVPCDQGHCLWFGDCQVR